MDAAGDLVQSSADFNAASSPDPGSASSPVAHPNSCNMATAEFPDSENEKFDSDWLLTPFVASLIPSLEKKSPHYTVGEMETPVNVIHPAALQSRSVNCLENSSSGLDSSSVNKAYLSSGGSAFTKSRSVTPTRKSSLLAKVKTSSRAPTPSASRCTLPSTTASTKPHVKASTPKESTTCLTMPVAKTSLLSSRSTSRSATPTRPLAATLSSAPAPLRRSSSVKKSAPSRGSSPTVRSKTWKTAEVRGISLDTPPSSKASVMERPASASRIRPGASTESALSRTVINEGTKQRACSSLRGEAHHGNSVLSSRSVLLGKSRVQAQSDKSDSVNPVLIGTQMVERVVNMRKLAPPKLEHSCYGQMMTAEKSSSLLNSSGFGRTLSKTSLDMALRHMDIGKATSSSLPATLNQEIVRPSISELRRGM